MFKLFRLPLNHWSKFVADSILLCMRIGCSVQTLQSKMCMEYCIVCAVSHLMPYIAQNTDIIIMVKKTIISNMHEETGKLQSAC